ncbi:MAG TPA: hypothetical protein VF587_05790, partial [Solirubrobacteraceae bacterium]
GPAGENGDQGEPGSADPGVLMGHTTGLLTGGGQDTLALVGAAPHDLTGETLIFKSPPYPVTATDFRVTLDDAAPGAGDARQFNFNTIDEGTLLSCTIANSFTSCEDSDSGEVPANSTIYIYENVSGSPEATGAFTTLTLRPAE